MATLVDSNVLIDVLAPRHVETRAWSLGALKTALERGPIIFSAVVWAEVSTPGVTDAVLQRAFAWLRPMREDYPFAAAHAAGLAHLAYRMRGGSRDRTLPDFLIGSHALLCGYALLTRDASRYRSYFPALGIIAPDTHP